MVDYRVVRMREKTETWYLLQKLSRSLFNFWNHVAIIQKTRIVHSEQVINISSLITKCRHQGNRLIFQGTIYNFNNKTWRRSELAENAIQSWKRNIMRRVLKQYRREYKNRNVVHS